MKLIRIRTFLKLQISLLKFLLISPAGNQSRFIIARLIYCSKAIYLRQMNNKIKLITLYHADKFPFDIQLAHYRCGIMKMIGQVLHTLINDPTAFFVLCFSTAIN